MACRATRACSFVFAALLLSTSTTIAAERSIAVEARLGQTVMKAGETQRNYIRIAVNGCEREKVDRPPVNIALVIDRSGSMQGLRIAQAQEAAISALKRLDKNDIASVVIFDDRIDVLVPAQQVVDHNMYIDRIRQVSARGSTAIHAGVMQGAEEVRKFKDKNRLNRILLLSDGLANVGPSKPDDFDRLGAELLTEGISVSTIGLGLQYNEDLMAKLARASDGNHAFVSEPADLIQIFNREFDDVLASCAQTVSIDVDMRPGVKLVRSLSRDGSVTGQHANFRMNQVYQATEHYVLLEVELDKSVAASDGPQDLGTVRVAYTQDGTERRLEAGISGRFSASDQEVKAGRDGTVLESVVEQTTRERAKTAIELRDKGKINEAQALFKQNAAEINAYTAAAPATSARIQSLQKEYDAIATQPAASPSQWNAQRKSLKQIDTAPAGAKSRF